MWRHKYSADIWPKDVNYSWPDKQLDIFEIPPNGQSLLSVNINPEVSKRDIIFQPNFCFIICCTRLIGFSLCMTSANVFILNFVDFWTDLKWEGMNISADRSQLVRIKFLLSSNLDDYLPELSINKQHSNNSHSSHLSVKCPTLVFFFLLLLLDQYFPCLLLLPFIPFPNSK